MATMDKSLASGWAVVFLFSWRAAALELMVNVFLRKSVTIHKKTRIYRVSFDD
jgi:hypothetical protein